MQSSYYGQGGSGDEEEKDRHHGQGEHAILEVLSTTHLLGSSLVSIMVDQCETMVDQLPSWFEKL